MNIEEAKIGDEVWVEGIISSSFSNGGVHVNHAGIDAFYDLERTKIKTDGYAEQSPKYLKNIIAKMRELPEHDRAVWIEGIIKEFGIENSLQTKDSLKPEIEQFVAEWYEENKEGLWETVIDLIRVDERLMYKHANPPKAPSKEDKRFLEWLFREDDAFEILSDMHKFGYEVEREKLYTVEIPNPNAPIEYHSKLAKNHKGEIVIEVQDWMNRTEYYQLTEQEIRKDFDWAWQWAKEVAE